MCLVWSSVPPWIDRMPEIMHRAACGSLRGLFCQTPSSLQAVSCGRMITLHPHLPHYSTLHPASQLLKVPRLSGCSFRHDVDVRLHPRVHRKFWLSVFPRPTIIRLTSITHLCDVVEDRNVSVLLSRQVPVTCKTFAITQVYWPYVWQVFDRRSW